MERRHTDHRNLNLAQLHLDAAFGRAGGKIIWQPRIGCWMQDKLFAQGKLPAPYTGMTLPEIYRSLSCSARIYEYNGCFVRIEDQQLRSYSRQIGDNVTEEVKETPVGKITCVYEFTPSSWYPLYRKRWCATEDDLRVLTWMEERCSWKYDAGIFQQVQGTWDDLGAPTIFMPRVNVQDLYINNMGVENGIYALYDFPGQVDKYFQALAESHERLIAVISQSPIEIINFGDNLHASTLSPKLFQKYVLPVYQRRCELLHQTNKFVHAHWDGDTKALLPFAKETGLDGIEAITPKPQGDVTLEEVKAALGDKLFLIDGIAATLFNDLYSLADLEAQARKVIDYFAPKLILGISDEISSTGDLERIRFVGKIVDDYNAALGS